MDKLGNAKIGRIKTSVNIAKAFVGASSFSLPWAFDKAGLFGAIAGIIIFAGLSNACLCLLPSLRDFVPGRKYPTFPQIGYAAFGTQGKVAVYFGMVAMTLGVCGSYLVFVAQSLSDLLDGYYQKQEDGVKEFQKGLGISFFSQTVCVLLALPVVGALSLMGSHRFLAKTSALGITAVLVSCIFVVYDCSQNDEVHFDEVSHYTSGSRAFELGTYPLFLGNAAYLYLITTAILPAHQNMREPEYFRACFTIAQVVVTLLNIAFATFAYMGYSSTANGIQDNVISNLTPGVVTTVVKLCMAINQLFTFVLFLNPMVDSILTEIQASEKCTANSDNGGGVFVLLEDTEQDKGALSPMVGGGESVPDGGGFAADSTAVPQATPPSVSNRRLSNRLVSPRPWPASIDQQSQIQLDGCGNIDSRGKIWGYSASTVNAVVRGCIVVLTAAVALACPKFGVLTGFTGGFGNNLLAFVYVPLFYYKLQRDQKYWNDMSLRRVCELVLMGMLFAFGVAMLILSTVSSVLQII